MADDNSPGDGPIEVLGLDPGWYWVFEGSATVGWFYRKKLDEAGLSYFDTAAISYFESRNAGKLVTIKFVKYRPDAAPEGLTVPTGGPPSVKATPAKKKPAKKKPAKKKPAKKRPAKKSATAGSKAKSGRAKRAKAGSAPTRSKKT